MEKQGMVGIQMMMLAEKVKTLGIYKTVEICAAMGYRCMEISEIPMTAENVQELKRACDAFDMKIAALSVGIEPKTPDAPGEFLARDFDKIVADCKVLDCHYLRLGMLPIACMGSREAALDFIQLAERYAACLAERGIALYYHNHHIEFVRYEGKFLLDLMKEQTQYLGFELDVHWCYRGGADPVALIRQYRGRIALLHLKDYRIGAVKVPKEPGAPVELHNIIEFAEVGEGSLPMQEIIETARACGSEYFLVEQDLHYGKDPFECLEMSRNNLVEMGYGAWFGV